MADGQKIAAYVASHATETKSILTGMSITDEELSMANVSVGAGEKILLVVKSWSAVGEKASELAKKVTFKGIGKMLGKALEKTRMGTFVITDKKIYWARLRPDTAAAGVTGIVGSISGECALDDLKQASIGEHDHCFGNAYMGHQLLVNGKVLGLLRMGSGIEFDEKAIDYLNSAFNACVNG